MRLSASLSFKDLVFPFGALPPVKVRLTLSQGGVERYREDFALSETYSTDVADVEPGDYVVTVQALDRTGAGVWDSDSRSVYLAPKTVILSVPSITGAALEEVTS